ncbi:MAG: SAM-dependent methyltransferase [Balneolaceae bacterium]
MGTLYLIPTPLGKRRENPALPEHTLDIVRGLRRFVVENIRTSQSFLQWIGHPLKPFEPDFRVLNKKTPDSEIFSFLTLLKKGDTGLMSEAGAPGVADPGAKLVRMAHDAGHTIRPLSGPSSILLALMASGMNGQQFAFHGYLPVDDKQRQKKIRELETDSGRSGQTQIFMEAPFRNDPLLETLIGLCKPETRLAVAVNLTMPDEEVVSLPVYKWKQRKMTSLAGRPALFLLLA